MEDMQPSATQLQFPFVWKVADRNLCKALTAQTSTSSVGTPLSHVSVLRNRTESLILNPTEMGRRTIPTVKQITISSAKQAEIKMAPKSVSAIVFDRLATKLPPAPKYSISANRDVTIRASAIKDGPLIDHTSDIESPAVFIEPMSPVKVNSRLDLAEVFLAIRRRPIQPEWQHDIMYPSECLPDDIFANSEMDGNESDDGNVLVTVKEGWL